MSALRRVVDLGRKSFVPFRSKANDFECHTIARPFASNMSALDRLRASQKEEADAFDRRNLNRVKSMPDELKQKFEKAAQLRSTVNELVEALQDHEFLGEGELLSELQNDNDNEGKAFEIDGELKRLRHLQSKLARRLEEVDAVLGANPC